MSNPTAPVGNIVRQANRHAWAASRRGLGRTATDAGLAGLCFLLVCGACHQTSNSAPDSAATGGATTGGSSSAGGRDSASATGGSSSLGGNSTNSGGTVAAASGGDVTGSGGAGAGGLSGVVGGVTGNGGGGLGGAGGTGTTSATGRGGSSGGSAGMGGATGTGGKTGQGGSGGTAATDAGTAGQGGGDAGSDAGTTLATDSLAVRFANMILGKWPDPAAITTSAGFEYNHGIVLRGIEQVYRHTGDSRYLAYIQKYIDENVGATGVINLGTAFVAFDDMQPSVLLPFLYQQTGLAKYKTAADTVRAFYDNIPTNGDGGFWHKQVYPDQMWLDGIYMGEPFLARYGAVFGTCGSYCGDTVVKQATLVGQHTLDTATGLYYHAWWDSNPANATNVKPAWPDANGRSPCIWGRAMGWYAMALVDTLGDLPADQAGRGTLLSNLTGLAAGLKTTQDATTGLWYQVMDQGSKTDNWTETSASGMFVYALKVAVNRGYIDASYSAVADSGWKGLQTKVTTDASGAPTITGAVQGMNVQNNYAGYVGQKTLSNSPHGLCAILLAASEMEAR